MAIILPNWQSNNSGQEESGAITSLSSFPDEVILSGNTSNFQFSLKPALQPFQKAFLFINIGAYIQEGETLEITSSVATTKIEASSLPSNGEFFTEASPTATAQYLQKVAQSIADALKQSLTFSNNYIIILQNSGVVLSALEYGSQFDISAVSSSPSIALQSDIGTSRFQSQNYIDYSAIATLYVGNEKFCTTVDKYAAIEIDNYTISSYKELSNLVVNTMSDFVAPVLPIKQTAPSSDFFAMDSGTTGAGVSIASEDEFGEKRFVIRPYFLVYSDEYRYKKGGEKKRYVTGVSPVRWVQLGAVDSLQPYDMNGYIWMPRSTKPFKWLTSFPVEKYVTYNSHEFTQLICKLPSAGGVFWLETKFTFYDGSFVTIQGQQNNYSGIGGNVSFDISPVVFDLKGVELNNGKLVDGYEVSLNWVSSGGSVNVSEARRFKVDRNQYKSSQNFIFLNEFGAWDSLEFKGDLVESLARSTKSIRRALPFNANKQDSVSSEVSLNVETLVNTVNSANSGILSIEVYRWVKKMLESSSLYLWNETLQQYESIVIESHDYEINTDLWGKSLSITYRKGVENNTINR